jgi:hypothetical protein
MAKLAPFFLTGANAKIRLNGKTLAYCTNITYSVDIPHTVPILLGNYEATSIEPLSYKVTGAFAIIRYIKDVKGALEALGYKTPQNTQNTGNGVGEWGPDNIFLRNGIVSSDGQAHKALNPAELDSAVMFDIEIYQKLPGSRECAVARFRNCRIVKADFTLEKRTPAKQMFSFQAIYADEDTFLANISGQGQQFG